MQFGRIAPDGHHWVAESGHGRIVFGVWGEHKGELIIGDGISPHWLTDDTVIWVDGPRVWQWSPMGGKALLVTLDRALNGCVTNQLGRWVAWSSQAVWDGSQWLEERSQPALGPLGELVTVTSDARIVDDAGHTLSTFPARDPQYTSGGLVWSEKIDGRYRACPSSWGQFTDALALKPIWTAQGPWLGVQENDRLIVHPKGNRLGYVVQDTPTTFRFDAVAYGNTIRFLWDFGDLHFHTLDLTDPRVDIGEGTAPEPPDPQPPTPEPPEPPEPEPIPMPLPPYLSSTQERLMYDTFRTDCVEANRLDFDSASQMGTHEARLLYDYCAGLSFDASLSKHRNAWRVDLGLPPFESAPVVPGLTFRSDFLGRWSKPLLMLGGMSVAEQDEQFAWMDTKGHQTIPLAVHNDYPRFPQWAWDWWEHHDALCACLDRCAARGKSVILMLHPRPGVRMRDHVRMVQDLWPVVRDRVSMVGWGWEINDMGGEWANGHRQLDYLRALQPIVSPCPIGVHFTPERWSGWPGFDGQDADRDEIEWLRLARGLGVTTLLYQEPPDKADAEQLDRMLHIPSPHGWSPGICGRVIDGAALEFVAFEYARDEAKHARIVTALQQDARVKGFC